MNKQTSKKRWFIIRFKVGFSNTQHTAIVSVGADSNPNTYKRLATEQLATTIARRKSKSIIVTEFEDLGDNPIFIS